MAIKVFISHKDRDSDTASAIGLRLRQHGIEWYLDTIDSSLEGDSPRLANHLRDKMSQRTQLLAIISPITQSSWWVPWEIGVASEKDFPLATYAASNTSLPSYLTGWPILRTFSDLDLYAQKSQELDRKVLLEGRRAYSSTGSRADYFHRSLKASLGQR